MGTQQTAAAVFDIDRDGVNDFVIAERTAAPAVVWYRRGKDGWTRYVIEAGRLRPEAGATFADVDGDGDLDFVAGGDGSSNEVWWWENPYPNFDPAVPWKRRLIKNSGRNKHHDLMFVDADGDGRQELVFWNQGDHRLPDGQDSGRSAHDRTLATYDHLPLQRRQRTVAARAARGLPPHE